MTDLTLSESIEIVAGVIQTNSMFSEQFAAACSKLCQYTEEYGKMMDFIETYERGEFEPDEMYVRTFLNRINGPEPCKCDPKRHKKASNPCLCACCSFQRLMNELHELRGQEKATSKANKLEPDPPGEGYENCLPSQAGDYWSITEGVWKPRGMASRPFEGEEISIRHRRKIPKTVKLNHIEKEILTGMATEIPQYDQGKELASCLTRHGSNGVYVEYKYVVKLLNSLNIVEEDVFADESERKPIENNFETQYKMLKGRAETVAYWLEMVSNEPECNANETRVAVAKSNLRAHAEHLLKGCPHLPGDAFDSYAVAVLAQKNFEIGELQKEITGLKGIIEHEGGMVQQMQNAIDLKDKCIDEERQRKLFLSEEINTLNIDLELAQKEIKELKQAHESQPEASPEIEFDVEKTQEIYDKLRQYISDPAEYHMSVRKKTYVYGEYNASVIDASSNSKLPGDDYIMLREIKRHDLTVNELKVIAAAQEQCIRYEKYITELSNKLNNLRQELDRVTDDKNSEIDRLDNRVRELTTEVDLIAEGAASWEDDYNQCRKKLQEANRQSVAPRDEIIDHLQNRINEVEDERNDARKELKEASKARESALDHVLELKEEGRLHRRQIRENMQALHEIGAESRLTKDRLDSIQNAILTLNDLADTAKDDGDMMDLVRQIKHLATL